MPYPREIDHIFYRIYLWISQYNRSIASITLSIVINYHTLLIINQREWRCIYIPYLPSSLLETLHATTPYIIGLHCSLKIKVLSEIDCFDKIIVYLDEDRITGANVIGSIFYIY